MRNFFCGALCAILAACSGSSGNGLPPNPNPVEIEGEWAGTYLSIRGAAGVLGMTIQQVGPTKVVTDDLFVNGTGQCFPFPDAEGSWDGISLEMVAELNTGGLLRVVAAGVPFTGDTMRGTYEVIGGPCIGDQGEILLTRTGP